MSVKSTRSKDLIYRSLCEGIPHGLLATEQVTQECPGQLIEREGVFIEQTI